MEFKVFLLCLVILVAATSAAKVCKCEEEKKVTKYKLKVKDGDKEVDEELEVDTEKQTEKYRIPKTDSGNSGEVDVVYDFKKNLTMQRLSAAKACFLSESTEDMPKPDDLVKLLDQKNPPSTTVKNATNSKYEVISELTDRSDLSDEMASLCAKLPIYRVKETTSTRGKRWPCYTYCYKYYYYCYTYHWTHGWAWYVCYKWRCYIRC
ncbi:uncharacterized protein LOC144653466 [Oculina patagonica]